MVRQSVDDGQIFIRGAPPLLPVHIERIGGVLDTVERGFCKASTSPIAWYVGERQFDLLLDRSEQFTRQLVYSAEGGGKTVLGAQWLVVQIILDVAAGSPGALGKPVYQGATAPTHERLQTLVKALGERIPISSAREQREGAWGTYYTEERELRLVCGHTVQFRSTKKQSDATGSPVQGFTWVRSLDDELQDTVENGADPDIEARMRGAKTSRRFGTATAKDSPSWRTFRDSKTAGTDWKIERIRFDENPFVWPEHWERMKRNMSAREWDRRGEAKDVGPERMTYTSWDREQNLRPVPQIGAEPITGNVLAPWGRQFKVLVGHDPGKLCDVSLILEAFKLRGQSRPAWWVRGELTTDQTTTEQHAQKLLEFLRSRWQVNLLNWKGELSDGSLALVRADPYSDSGNDANRPDRSVYTVFRKMGIAILPAAIKASVTESKAATVPKDGGIDMVNTLFCNAAGERRLFIECDERRRPLAPRLVEAIEMSERDGDGKAEMQRKNRYDLSHWPAALRYALWAIERPRMHEVAA